MSNSTTIQSSHTCDLLLTDFPLRAQQANILPGLEHNSLISVRQLCYNGCSITFTQEQITVSKKWKICNVRIPRSKITLVTSRFENRFEINKVQCNHAHDKSNQKDLIKYLNAACFSPVKSAWITAITNVNFTTWPGLTEHAVEKHLSKSTSTTKGHLNQQRQNARTAKVKDPKVLITEPDLDQGINTQLVYAATIDAGQIYTDKQEDFQWCQAKVTNTS
jgi:hypothetical protein